MKQQQEPNWQAIYKHLTLYAHQRLAYFRIVDVELAQDFISTTHTIEIVLKA